VPVLELAKLFRAGVISVTNTSHVKVYTTQVNSALTG